MKIKRSTLYQFLGFSINPFIGIVMSSIYALNRKMSPLAIALSLGLVSVYLPVMYDVSHGYFSYFDYNSGYSERHLHPINMVASYLSKAKIDYIFVIFIFTVLSLYMWFSMCSKIGTKALDRKFYSLIFTIFILATTYKEIMDLNRTYFSYMLAVYSIFQSGRSEFWAKYKNIFLILSIYFHFSALVIVLPYLLSRYITIKKGWGWGFIAISLALGLNFNVFFEPFVGIFPESKFLSYLVSEKWGMYSSIEAGRLVMWGVQLSVIVALLSAVNKECEKRNLTTFIVSVCIFLFFIKFRVFGERFFIACLLLMPILIYNIKRINTALVFLAFLMFLKFITYNFVVFGYVFTKSYNQVIESEDVRVKQAVKPLFLPTPFLLAVSEFGYSNEILIKNAKRREEQ